MKRFTALLLVSAFLAPPTSSGQSTPIATTKIAEALGTEDAHLRTAIVDGAIYAHINLQGRVEVLRIMPVAFQESLMHALYAFARAYVESDLFSAEYLKQRQESMGVAVNAENSYYPRSARELVRQRLHFYLEQTSNVDFTATLELRGGVAIFALKEFEEKEPLWKACYRMGPKICSLSRLLAEQWVKDLDAQR